MEVKDCFDKHGDFILKGFDPYRVDGDEKEDELYNSLFDEDGDTLYHVEKEISSLMRSECWKWDCDAACIYHAGVHGGNTKGSYPAIYYWR